MATDLKSRIILAKNIKMDRNYNNVLSYTEDEMLNLCLANRVAEVDNYSFIRTNRSILSGFDYETVLQANYIAFQNKDYSNKWFFGWIDDVIYKGDNNTEIMYTIDSWSTWYDYWDVETCYVSREHVNDDTIGANTVPEGLDTGEYIADTIQKLNEMNDVVAVLQVTKTTTTNKELLATNYGGIWAAGGAYICETIEQLVNLIQSYGEGKNDAIIQVYLVPKAFIEMPTGSLQFNGQSSPKYIEKTFNRPTTLDGYTPKNKKLLTFPYCFMNVSNNNGSTNTYYYELFKNAIKFNIKGVPCVGASIKLTPYNYKNSGENNNEEEGIMAGKFPTLSWSEDSYTNWLTQNAVNIGLGLSSNLLSIVGGLASANPVAGVGGLISGSMGIASQLGSMYQHSLVPYTAQGNTNGGDINVCSKNNGFIFYQMNIRSEYAKIIDDYFTRFGYKINRLKKPNITGRRYFNYVEIAGEDDIGFGTVPANYMENINGACRKGVTIWHSHDAMGDFSLNNDII